MISIILTSYNEPKSIAKAISSLIDPAYNGTKEEIQLITVIPDDLTRSAAKQEVTRLHFQNWIDIKDEMIGKPAALNLAFKHVKGDVTVFTDGDVYFAPKAIANLVKPLRDYDELGGVSGRQHSIDSRSNMFGYYSHLFNEALHRARLPLIHIPHNGSFFPLSGYIMAVKSNLLDPEIPIRVLVDDAYISYRITQQGKRIGYAPEAVVNVSYPKNIKDYIRQKVRSTGGYLQLKQMGLVNKSNRSRTIIDDLKQIALPLSFAKTPKELIWSLLLYPIRAYLWIKIFALKLFKPQQFNRSWVRIESSKPDLQDNQQ